MKKISLLYTSFAVLICLLLLHLAGSFLYLYWTLNWFDTLVHFFGGVSVGFFALWIWWDSGIRGHRRPSLKEAITLAIIVVGTIGIGWEIFEYIYDITQSTEGYVPDTTHDLIADLLGAMTAGIWGSKKIFYAD